MVDGMKVKNLFSNIPTQLPEEMIEVLVRAERVRVERIVSKGHQSPAGFWYDQAEEEWVMVLKGKGRLEFEADGRMVEMSAGDAIYIPAHVRHRVAWTSPDEETIWLAVFYS
jgi:cupin 2 domain-containing protein